MTTQTTPRSDPQYRLDEQGLAAVTLTLGWADAHATHEEQMHVGNFSVWREADLLPAAIGRNIPGMCTGDTAGTRLQPGETLAAWDPARVISGNPAHFDRQHRHGLVVEPRLGRFYPQGFFHRFPGMRSAASLPARITGLTPQRMEIDLNHPLARFPLQLQFRLDQVLPGFDRRGGRCSSPLDDLLRYPGLAAPLANGNAADYGDTAGGMSRMDERDDAIFYSRPRLVQHLDTRALDCVNALYRRLIPERAAVLDLMASFDSHLQDLPAGTLQVLGMNAEELAANRTADNRVLQDLNASPALPFAADSLDAVVCTASIEYLTRPVDVLKDTLRVLRPGAVAVITFSNRWFPGKAIRVWSELHEFERVGMVVQWLQRAGFTGLHTCSARGWPRPAEDPHAAESAVSDPVYGVWGSKPAA